MTGNLGGLTVAVTGSRRANELAHLVSSHGGSPFVAPTVGIETKADLRDEVERFRDVLLNQAPRFAIFMTGPGVFSLFPAARASGMDREIVDGLSKTTVIARSGKPKDALVKHGVRVDLVPEEATSPGILTLLERYNVAGDVVIVLSHGSEASVLCDALRKRKARVVEISTYSYSQEMGPSGARVLDSMRFAPVMPVKSRVLELIDKAVKGEIDVMTFTSPPSVNNLFATAAANGKLEALRSTLNSRVVVVAVGPPTRAAIENGGVVVDVMPTTYKMGAMIKDLCGYVKVYGKEKRR